MKGFNQIRRKAYTVFDSKHLHTLKLPTQFAEMEEIKLVRKQKGRTSYDKLKPVPNSLE
jgi:hypothetical protein